MTFDYRKFLSENKLTEHSRTLNEDKYYEVHATGEGWSYTSLVKAKNETEAAEKIKKEPRLRKMARQNGTPIKDVDTWVSKTTFKAGIGEMVNEGKVQAWDVYLRGKNIDTVFYTDKSITADEIKRSLVDHDGYDPNIVVKKAK